jgi:hypothetical protein
MHPVLIGRISRVPDRTTESNGTAVEQKLKGLLFSILIPLVPILIVALSPPQTGGAFVAGYLVGAVTAPFVVFGAIKAADDLFNSGWLNSVLGVLIYLAAVILLSVAAIIWSFYFAVS